MIYLICYYVVPFLAFSLAFIKYLERVLFYRKVYVGCQGFSAKAQKKQYLFNLAMLGLFVAVTGLYYWVIVFFDTYTSQEILFLIKLFAHTYALITNALFFIYLAMKFYHLYILSGEKNSLLMIPCASSVVLALITSVEILGNIQLPSIGLISLF